MLKRYESLRMRELTTLWPDDRAERAGASLPQHSRKISGFAHGSDTDHQPGSNSGQNYRVMHSVTLDRPS